MPRHFVSQPQQRARPAVALDTVEEWRAAAKYWQDVAAGKLADPRRAALPQPQPAAQPQPRAEDDPVVAQARADAAEVLRLCSEFGRHDMAGQLLDKSPAEARKALVAAMWDDAFSKSARARGVEPGGGQP